ncbi:MULTISPECIES: ABC transporter ATP-binding protein [Gordonia]|uniref:Trehalose import ATP-binding protein SugC n=1 Tax=Gordonia aquimaris TaxID=2984863 RepID=A0A9X3I4J3_9ACTN|nr:MULTISPECIES: sn-glycerol-3-phosphate ABC transporter ATP-binding protein UgpC [Gordonia]MAU80369.1 sugar ABC transporter ATP-binding protein [Gordonia sp. (in: high G+C Gram-positive bacteria)]MCX2964271.1 sn-glycerol-3-phosphate ABC transporter ATP-binding protein UgpC [Gordonia aquimaris]
MASITYDQACCVYPGADKLAVDRLDLDIEDGEFVVLVGPSGSGKSTALRMLAGLEEIDSGAIRIGGDNMVGVAPKDRDIAMVFQNYALYPNKTVGENMGFALKMRGVPAEERKAKVAEAARLLDLTDFLDRKPAKLSGGQRQRVAMGRAIVREPQVFCMDEPLSNLDAKLRVQTRTQIAALQRRLGTTTVYVTHDQVEAMTMGDRVAVLRHGVLQQFSTPADLYDRPVNAFVAGFIGSPAMNLFTAPVNDGAVTIAGSTVDLDDESQALLRGSGLGKVIVGIRPEHLAIGDAGIDADVALLEELGSESYIYARVDDPSIANLDGEPVTLVARSSHRAPAKAGEAVRLHQVDRAVHLFDPDTGDRIVG